MAEDCPAEVWSRIFTLACTDGGFTGCSLSRVSRYFREVVFPTQLRSVALKGGDKIAHFADVLSARPPEHRRVQHLFLMGGEGKPATASNATMYKAVALILSLVGKNLETLTSLLPQRNIDRNSILCTELPSLVELTVHGYFLLPVRIESGAQMQESFPSLRYLHILSSCHSAVLYTTRAPALTHLRLSAVLDPFLQVLRGFLSDNSLITSPPPLLPPTLQKILLQRDAGLSRIRTFISGPRTSANLKELLRVDKENKIVVIDDIRRRDGSLAPEHYKEGRKHWEERIDGGEGCWAENTRIMMDTRMIL